tara:strand:- start:25 stop:627 length:603 start_codon:yes stop_codon:yes gene_type:complete
MAINVANNNSLSAITALPAAVSGGAMTLLSTTTASSSSTVDITSGIDSTYKEYIIKYINVHPASDSQHFYVNFRDGSTAYDATKTTTFFEAEHQEDDGGTGLAYNTAADLAQATGVQRVTGNVGADNDQCCSGYLVLYDPSNTTFVKHFVMRTANLRSDDIAFDSYVAGYCNTTSAIDGVQFSFASGAVASGTFKLYGVS